MAVSQSSYEAVLSTLEAYFPVVCTLQTYLEATLDDHGLCLQMAQQADTNIVRFNEFLGTTYIASKIPLGNVKRLLPMSPISHMQDVGDVVAEHEFVHITLSYR